MNDEYKVIRQSLIEWYSFSKDDEVLIINPEDSSLDEFLQEKSQLTIVNQYKKLLELSDKQMQYDTIIMYDLYGFCIEFDVEIEELVGTLLALKKSKGVAFIAMENKLGMKYWAGCQEEQERGYYVGIEDYNKWKSKIKPLSKKEFEDVLMAFEKMDYSFYYPYPDYKYPIVIYSDECLPKEGELVRNFRNIDGDRYVMFDERCAFDSVIKAGLFPEFSNSYLVYIK